MPHPPIGETDPRSNKISNILPEICLVWPFNLYLSDKLKDFHIWNNDFPQKHSTKSLQCIRDAQRMWHVFLATEWNGHHCVHIHMLSNYGSQLLVQELAHCQKLRALKCVWHVRNCYIHNDCMLRHLNSVSLQVGFIVFAKHKLHNI